MTDLGQLASTLLAWALTFAIHSTILLAGATLLDRWLRDRSEILSPVWKLAALGGVLTATVQLASGIEPLGGRLLVGATPEATSVAEPPKGSVRPRIVVAGAPTELPEVELAGQPAPALPSVAVHDVGQPRSSVAAAVGAPPERGAALAVVVLGLLGAMVGLAGIGHAWWRLRVQLRGRRAADGPLVLLLERLLARARLRRAVRLSISRTIGVPLATGIVRPEIVVPERALASLGPAAQQSMLAHELAHVLRRDPAWRLGLLVLERVLFFQPLLRLARRRVAQHAEYLSDAWAVRSTAQPLELARCLTEIAGWVQRAPTPALAAGMAEPRSILGRRVLRLVEPQRRPASARGLPWLAVAGLFAMVMVAPAIGSAHGRAHVMRHAAADGAPMIVVVHEDGRAAGELETSPPGLPARAAVVAAPAPEQGGDRKQRRAARKAKPRAEHGAAQRRRDTEVALRRTIRAAHAQDRLPTLDELAIVLGEGTPEPGRAVAGVRIRGDREAVVIVLDGDGDHRIVERRVHRDVAHEVAIARAQAEVHRRTAERVRVRVRVEEIQRARERAIQDYVRAWNEAARGRRDNVRRGRPAPPARPDIMPIVAPVAPLPPMPPAASWAPRAPRPPLAPPAPPAPPAFAPVALPPS